MIVLEGPDGAGKTTLARRLLPDEVQFNTSYRHEGPPGLDEDLFARYRKLLTRECLYPSCRVYDRLFHGELVYGPVIRGFSKLTRLQVRYLELLAHTAQATFLFLTASPLTLIARGDPIYKQVEAGELVRRYDELFEWSTSDRLQVVTEPGQPGPIVGNTFAEPWYHRGVGHREPDVVIVGEAWPGRWPSPDDPAWEVEPYASCRPFDGSRSGQHLLAALDPLLRCGLRVYLTNARKQWTKRSGEALRSEVAGLKGSPPLIVLGQEALREVKVAGLATRVHAVLDHPAYVARFHLEKLEAWGDKLRGSAWEVRTARREARLRQFRPLDSVDPIDRKLEDHPVDGADWHLGDAD